MKYEELEKIPRRMREARTLALVYTGKKLKAIKTPKHIRRRLLLELDIEIWLRIEEKMISMGLGQL